MQVAALSQRAVVNSRVKKADGLGDLV